jgi:GNAT superfamily N-acetyltransferase
MTDDEIAVAIEENVAEFLLALGRAGGGEERDERGAGRRIQWTAGGSPIAYHNAVVRAELGDEEADREIEGFIGRLRALGVAGSWHVGPSMRPGDLCRRLEAHGFGGCEEAAEPAMAASLERLPEAVAPAGFVVERVRGAEQLAGFRGVLASGFGEGEPEANWVCETYARIGLGDETNWRHYLGSIDGEAVSTASVFHAAEVAGIYFVCTRPERRRLGLGAATTLAAMRGARDEGYRQAVLTSSAMGYRVYEQLGFRELFTMYVPEIDPR